MLKFHAIGDWAPGAVRIAWTSGARAIVPAVESEIETSWSAAQARLGDRLFDGPMCRMERWDASEVRLELTLSRTSYKAFLGTNLMNSSLADRHGAAILSNPVGVSSALVTSDDWLMLGRRNDSVAYYPNRIHPFAGALEPSDALDVFSEVRRELNEELGLVESDLSEIRCGGIAEDLSLRQPELIFRAATSRTRAQIELAVDDQEHCASVAIATRPASMERAMEDPLLTPVAVAALVLYGRNRFGAAWFEQMLARHRLST